MVYLLPYRRSRGLLAAAFFSTVAITTVAYLVAKNTDFMERWEASYYESSLGGREENFLPPRR